MHGAENKEFWLTIVSLDLCSLGSYFFLWYYFFSCSHFPQRTSNLINKSLWTHLGHDLNPEPFKRSLQRNLSKTTQVKIGSTVLWSCQTCPPAGHGTVTWNEKHCRWPTSCPVQWTALLHNNVCGGLDKGMTLQSESGKCLLRIRHIQRCCRDLV